MLVGCTSWAVEFLDFLITYILPEYGKDMRMISYEILFSHSFDGKFKIRAQAFRGSDNVSC